MLNSALHLQNSRPSIPGERMACEMRLATLSVEIESGICRPRTSRSTLHHRYLRASARWSLNVLGAGCTDSVGVGSAKLLVWNMKNERVVRPQPLVFKNDVSRDRSPASHVSTIAFILPGKLITKPLNIHFELSCNDISCSRSVVISVMSARGLARRCGNFSSRPSFCATTAQSSSSRSNFPMKSANRFPLHRQTSRVVPVRGDGRKLRCCTGSNRQIDRSSCRS